MDATENPAAAAARADANDLFEQAADAQARADELEAKAEPDGDDGSTSHASGDARASANDLTARAHEAAEYAASLERDEPVAGGGEDEETLEP